jgi:hypothetical protein
MLREPAACKQPGGELPWKYYRDKKRQLKKTAVALNMHRTANAVLLNRLISARSGIMGRMNFLSVWRKMPGIAGFPCLLVRHLIVCLPFKSASLITDPINKNCSYRGQRFS